MEVTIDEPMADQPSNWTLVGTTELNNATWFVDVKDSAGQTINEQQSVQSQEFSQPLSAEAPVPAEITVRVSGRIPEIGTEDLNYGNIAAENYTVMALTQDGERTLEGGEFRSHRYDSDSQHKEAREALDSAAAAVEESGSSSAQDTLDDAIAFYNNGDFQNAIDSANEAEDQAESSGNTLLLIGGAAVVLLVLIGGGYYYWRSQQTSQHKLQ